jgi:hypothetical protein
MQRCGAALRNIEQQPCYSPSQLPIPSSRYFIVFMLNLDLMSSNSRNCYSRNGTQIDDVAYQPCSSDSSRDSVCCGTNHQGAGHTNVANDVCDPNGLCQNFEAFDGTNAGVKVWWRQGCTDPTWQSEHRLKDVCNFAKVREIENMLIQEFVNKLTSW